MKLFAFGPETPDRRATVRGPADKRLLGWYGKLPALGDFASRRMPPDLLHAWDTWLATGLSAWSARDPDGWLAAYLAAPSWCFLRIVGGVVWVGVLMPSVDRVGRYFPFTLTRPLARPPADAAEALRLLAWLHRADDLAVDALHDEWTIEALESALGGLATEAPGWFDDTAASAPRRPAAVSIAEADGADDPAPAGATDRLVHPDDLATLLVRIAPGGRTGQRPGGLWWFRGTDVPGAMQLRIERHLPRGADFAELLGRPAAGSPGSNHPSDR